jgi:4-hydroxy-tetrahydrodipicolinate synthase
VYAASVTPLKPDFSPDLESLPALLAFFASRGCDGALLLGTTGEGPSFSARERQALFRAALEVRQAHPSFRLLAGTGTPSMEETIEITKQAFNLGFDGAVVLPPYYFRKVSDEGLFAWFSQIMGKAVPEGAYLLGYHFPKVSGVPLSIDLLARLKDEFPGRFAGLKDSSADSDYARQLGERFGGDFAVMSGTDSLFSQALSWGASGCITAPANLFSPDLKHIWDLHQQGKTDPRIEARIATARRFVDSYPPAPPLLKAMLARGHGFPRWPVRPPLLPLPAEVEEKAADELNILYDL